MTHTVPVSDDVAITHHIKDTHNNTIASQFGRKTKTLTLTKTTIGKRYTRKTLDRTRNTSNNTVPVTNKKMPKSLYRTVSQNDSKGNSAIAEILLS